MVLRQVDYWATVYRRTWRGSVFTSFVTPMFYVLAMGVLLGEFIDDGSADLQGAPTYLAFIAPGLVAHAMMIAVGEVTWPVLGAIKWNRTYLGMVATPLSVADVVAAHFAFVLFRVATTCGVFLLVLALFGVFASFWGAVAAFAVQLLIGMAFAAPIYGFSAGLKDQIAFALIYRVGVMPLFLFSGAFFPVSNLPDALQVGRRDAAVARGQPDPDAHPGRRRRRARPGPPRLPDRAVRGGLVVVGAPADEEAGALMSVITSVLVRPPGRGWSPSWRPRAAQLHAHRQSKVFFLIGFLGAVLYLFSIGIGVGQMIDSFQFNGQTVAWRCAVASGMLAASAMNGAVLDSTFSVFFKLKFEKLYDAVLATPMRTTDVARGEITHAAARRGLLDGLPAGDARDGARGVVVGGAGGAGDAAHRLRVLGGLHGADHLHAVVAGLRVRQPGDHAAVPVLGDVLPDHGVRRCAAVGGGGEPAPSTAASCCAVS